MDGERDGRTRAIKDWTQYAMLLFATAWGVYTFVYKETILPARRPATLTVTAQLEELARDEAKALVRLRIHAINRTDRKVYVPALWFTVRGVQFGQQTGDAEEYRSRVTSFPQAEIHARYSTVEAADIVAVGTILNQTTCYYEPTDETTNEVLFEVPLERYDALEAKTQFFLTKETDGLSLEEWNVETTGELYPRLLLHGRDYDPGFNAAHFDWGTQVGAGFNWASSTLALWPVEKVVGSSRVDLQACKLEYSIVSPK